MKTFGITFAAVAAVALALGSCAGMTSKEIIEESPKTDFAIAGQWRLENIVVSDSDYVRPSEVTPEEEQYVVFTDTTYSFHTNCNTIFGNYTLSEDSIKLGDGGMTRMACPNTDSEQILVRVIPDIQTYEVQNDSVLRLNGKTPAECILLVKESNIEAE